jgi:lipoate-protein ligase A
MIDKIHFIMSTNTNPYKNLALEEYLLKTVKDNECIMYLWQNEKTVVIGKNQNPWKECKIAELEADGGSLVRRLSGGGAVFHDLGNLNFTFFATKDNYNVERQLQVILEAVKLRGIPAEKTGRNDISVEGKKFSGNAFFSDGIHCYHHGTILVNVDMCKLSLYLNVSRDKLSSKGVESVRSRVTNLTEYDNTLTIDYMKKELLEAFATVYELTPEPLVLEESNLAVLDELEHKFASQDWIFGKKLEFNYSMDSRFAWGDIDIKLVIHTGIIKECSVYSDALEIDLFDLITKTLTGCRFASVDMCQSLGKLNLTEMQREMMLDVSELIRYENI